MPTMVYVSGGERPDRSSSPAVMPTTADIFHSGTGADAKCDVLGLDDAGQVLEKRSPWRLSIISDFFWAVVNTVTFLYVFRLSSLEATCRSRLVFESVGFEAHRRTNSVSRRAILRLGCSFSSLINVHHQTLTPFIVRCPLQCPLRFACPLCLLDARRSRCSDCSLASSSRRYTAALSEDRNRGASLAVAAAALLVLLEQAGPAEARTFME